MWDMVIQRNLDNGGNHNGKYDIKNIDRATLVEIDEFILGLPQDQYDIWAAFHLQIEYILLSEKL